jgi:hypothetical protein
LLSQGHGLSSDMGVPAVIELLARPIRRGGEVSAVQPAKTRRPDGLQTGSAYRDSFRSNRFSISMTEAVVATAIVHSGYEVIVRVEIGPRVSRLTLDECRQTSPECEGALVTSNAQFQKGLASTGLAAEVNQCIILRRPPISAI